MSVPACWSLLPVVHVRADNSERNQGSGDSVLAILHLLAAANPGLAGASLRILPTRHAWAILSWHLVSQQHCRIRRRLGAFH